MSVAGACTHPSVTHSNVLHSIVFLYRSITEQYHASNIKYKKIYKGSPTYIVEQCLESGHNSISNMFSD